MDLRSMLKNPFNYRLNVGVKREKVSRMTPRFLAQAIGWVEVPFTNMGDREEWQE